MPEEAAIGQFDDAVDDAVEKIAIVRDQQEGAVKIFEKLRDPFDGFVVEDGSRRLVEHQKIRLMR